jgi:hypothetical protein
MNEPKNPVLWMILCCLIFGTLLACTTNDNVKNYGGTGYVKLDPGRKFVNITWKDNNMWILTRKMKEGEKAEEFEFKESSDMGVWEGKLIIIEQEPEAKK